MSAREHNLHQRWKLWMQLRTKADELRRLANRWVNADPELRHYIWLLEKADPGEHQRLSQHQTEL